jgi:hypothetical protein
MADEVFGPLVAFSDVEDQVLAHYKLWMHTWLCARERAVNLDVGAIARPRSYVIKQSFTALPGEESTPLVVVVSDGFAAQPERRGSGRHDARFRFGIAVVCYGIEGSARELCGHYQAAILGIALRHRTINGVIEMDDFVDLKIEDIDEEVMGRSMAAVRITLWYKVPGFADEYPALDLIEPPVDPGTPQPPLPEVETVDVETEKYQVTESLPYG